MGYVGDIRRVVRRGRFRCHRLVVLLVRLSRTCGLGLRRVIGAGSIGLWAGMVRLLCLARCRKWDDGDCH